MLLGRLLFISAVVFLAGCTNSKEEDGRASQPDATEVDNIVVDKEEENVLAEVKVLYDELLKFKDKEDFRKYGFMTDGPYNSWLNRVKELKDNHDSKILIDKRIFIDDLMQLGFAYVVSKGKETTVTEIFNQDFSDAFSSKPVETIDAPSGRNNYDRIKNEYKIFGKWTISNSIVKNSYKYEIYKRDNEYIGVMIEHEFQTEILERKGNNYFIKGKNVNNDNGEYYRIDSEMNMTLFDKNGGLVDAGYKATKD